ncbi:MAG: L,D-transpeptidase [Beijerinckiaceae bacterium]
MLKMAGFLGLTCGFFGLSTAQATVRIDIDLTTQTMNVQSANGSYTWAVSTARSGYVTPRGTFSPYSLQRMHYSHKYHMSPMPYSIFFAGGYAIHGTYSVAELGRPASHGCIRLLPANAALLYHLVQTEGAAISISGSPPYSYAAVHRAKAGHALAYTRERQPAPAVDTWQANPLSFWPSAR